MRNTIEILVLANKMIEYVKDNRGKERIKYTSTTIKHILVLMLILEFGRTLKECD
jgi:hypothetical protein